MALVAMEVRGAWRDWLSGMCWPVRYGESCEAWRSLLVIVCQNDRKAAPKLDGQSVTMPDLRGQNIAV